ncbi:MAG: TauD/TfdA family dioxygenase [Cyanobacteria bacterium J06621_8]
MSCNFPLLIPFGVEKVGRQIRQIGNAEIIQLKNLLAEHGVVVLREQNADDKVFVDFLQRLGTITFTVGEKPVPNEPLLNVVSNVGRTRPPRSVFHTDTSYVAQPPAYTALRIIAVPTSGGETLFSNQYRAYETLPIWVKQRLKSAKVQHVVSGLTLDDSQEKQSWHPLFREHPLSGRIALYLSTPERCQQISGLSPAQSQRAIKLLYRHSIRPRHLYRHQWQAGDIVIWDNRCTMHRADHSQVVGDRILHRGLVKSTG